MNIDQKNALLTGLGLAVAFAGGSLWERHSAEAAASSPMVTDAASQPAAASSDGIAVEKAKQEQDCRENARYSIEAALKPLLKDPWSYERISFDQHELPERLGQGVKNPVWLAINYRAKNSFGAYDVAQAVVIFNAKDCREFKPIAVG